tara:strand:- start:27938 stop:30523 length:2586 start_codon:yes stop_codon:yes gene_type:complete
MLIDASHEEETRVAIVRGNRVEEFDYESAARKPLKGNIYLAKVTRVEPSLQAAFVDYGGNRHGFLAFSEIHPDYYQIPVADRQALIAEESEANADILEQDVADTETPAGDTGAASESNGAETISEDTENDENGADPDEAEIVESLHEDDEEEEARIRLQMARRLRRKYKIQEVIKKRQVILVQVVKEERGNKGAALTTYLSLPGRYCVLMPNTLHGGGVSRKISSAKDRKRLKTLLAELNMPEGMACIIRTAGYNRTKLEIKRDYDYLNRMWQGIRDLTLKSIAPALIYEEGNLIKRSIRDLYTREIDEVLVEGENGYRTAKDFMKLLMPSHAKKVKHYQDTIPLFQRFQVENHLDSMYNPTVQLRSGGYIVINPTEALVSIDVNSGKATKEHNIEETATKTNLEAAEEIARQLRLRDMAGLIVIDFIDMEDRGNIRAVERKMKECLKADRARIQVGRISSFGLMEMSRQRLRPGVLESSTRVCPHCEGIGTIRSVDSQALHIIRVIEEEGIRNRSSSIVVYLPADVAIYLLNNKRQQLLELENRYGFSIGISIDESLTENGYRLERTDGGAMKTEARNSLQLGAAVPTPTLADVSEEDVSRSEEEGDQQPKRRRKRRSRRRSRKDKAAAVEMKKTQEQPAQDETSAEKEKISDPETASDTQPEQVLAEAEVTSEETVQEDTAPKSEKRSRRRSSRARKKAEVSEEKPQIEEGGEDTGAEKTALAEAPTVEETEKAEETKPAEEEKPKRRRRPRRTKTAAKSAEPDSQEAVITNAPSEENGAEQQPMAASEKDADQSERERDKEKEQVDAPSPAAEGAEAETPSPTPSPYVNVIEVGKDTKEDKKKSGSGKKGWWQRAFGD